MDKPPLFPLSDIIYISVNFKEKSKKLFALKRSFFKKVKCKIKKINIKKIFDEQKKKLKLFKKQRRHADVL